MEQNQRRVFTAWLLLCVSCDQQHLWLGAVPSQPDGPDAAPLPLEDAGLDADSSPRDAADGAPLSDAQGAQDADSEADAALVPAWLAASIHAIGRRNVSSISGLCEGECIDVEVRATGGKPPYTVTWNHERGVTQRRICAQDTPSSITISDADDAGALASATFSVAGVPCLAGQPVPDTWIICSDLSGKHTYCGDGVPSTIHRFDLGQPLQDPDPLIYPVYTTGLLASGVELLAGADCKFAVSFGEYSSTAAIPLALGSIPLDGGALPDLYVRTIGMPPSSPIGVHLVGMTVCEELPRADFQQWLHPRSP